MQELLSTKHTAGKITILTGVLGVAIFLLFFLVNFSSQELQKVSAQDIASTSITVLNTPPQWTIDAEEEFESSTSSPTNSGSEISWVATATDPSAQPYFLIICSSGDPAIAASSSDYDSLGTAPPTCAVGATQWALSTSTVSGQQARAATTTSEDSPFVMGNNNWYAFICDDDPILPRCNASSTQGTGSTESPFHVNFRPVISDFYNNSPTLPGDVTTFTAEATDPDGHTIRLFVCSTNAFDNVGQDCTATTTASSSSLVAQDPNALFTVGIPTQDADYDTWAFVVDQHGHVALPLDPGPPETYAILTVANAPPYINPTDIVLNDSIDLTLSVHEGETTGFTLSFLASDNNSCENISEGPEITDFALSIFRTDLGTSSCSTNASDYDPNNCYPSGVASTTWNLSCTASSTSCTYADDGIDTTQLFECTFPLWHIADATAGGPGQSFYSTTDWSAAVIAIDDNGSSSPHTIGSIKRNLNVFAGYALDTFAIPYGQLEPGQLTTNLIASTSFRATGNAGIDQELSGESMCQGYSSTTKCVVSASSTIPDYEQVFATSSITYVLASSSGNRLSSTTPGALLELSVPKNIATSSSNSRPTYWGIAVPGSITFSGIYTGENTIIGVASDPLRWVP